MFPRIVAIGFLLAGSARIAGQDRFQEVQATAQPVYVADGLLPSEKHREIVECGEWRTDIVFGLPIAIRAQKRLGNSPTWAEGGVALYGLAPGIFGGLRFEGRMYEGERNAWFSRPGFDVYYSPIRGSRSFLSGSYRGVLALTFDSDLSWRREWSERLHGHLGLKAGFGVAFAGSNVWPVPVLGLTCGFQY